MKKGTKTRFPIILLCSAVIHLGVLAAIFGSWAYGIALKFGSFSYDDSGTNRVKVTMIDRTKPLYLPPGFYASQKPPEEIAKREKEETTHDKDKARKKDEPKKDEKDETEQKDGEDQKPEEPKQPAPAGDGKFGKISGGALKPHLQQIYQAYERGDITITTFSVTVACKAQHDGSLTDIKLLKSSGDDLIDKTAVNLVKEISAMNALAPLETLSSLSLTLQKTPTSATLTAVGFANDPDVSANFANQLGFLKLVSRPTMKNDDQKALLEGVKIDQSGNRVSVSLALPSSMAGDMMRRSFGSTAQATPAK